MAKNNKSIEKIFAVTVEQQTAAEKFIQEARQEVPNFYDEGECEIIYAPINDGEIRIFHHKPKKSQTKRPIIFLPGFSTTPWTWRDFCVPLHQIGEYYFLETREKNSSRVKRGRKTKMSIDQIAKDVGEAIKFLGLENKDYVLMSASFHGGTLMHGLLKKYFHPPTTVVLDPYPKFTQNKLMVGLFFGLTPPFLLEIIKFIIMKIVVMGMKNESQKERIRNLVDGAVAWKWRKGMIHNLKYNMYPHFHKIENEVFQFHGPKDRFHPREIYLKIASAIPKGRLFYIKAKDEERELLAGAIGKAFTEVTKEDELPKFFEQFEIKLKK
ncbi:MAG: hypothetical protein ACTSO7_12565 [Candidatus Heimdallarchaeota archaeon]